MTNNNYLSQKILAVLYPNNVIPNLDRAIIEMNAVERYLNATANTQAKTKKTTKATVTGVVGGASTTNTMITLADLTKNTPKKKRQPRNVEADAKRILAELQTAPFLTLKNVSKTLGLTSYGRASDLVTEMAKLGIVETRVTIPYGRGYARVFSNGPLKGYVGTAPESTTTTVATATEPQQIDIEEAISQAVQQTTTQ